MLKIKRQRSDGRPRLARGPFLTEHAEEGREVVLELLPTFARLRLKGQRRSLTLTYEAMWTRACQFEARAVADARRAARQAKKRKAVQR